MLPSVAWKMRVSSTLPEAWLNNQTYTNVIANVVGIPIRPSSPLMASGRCQPATRSPSITADVSGDRVACRRGSANPRKDGSSETGASRGFTNRSANTAAKLVQESSAHSGPGAPNPTFTSTAANLTASGSPTATAYQYQGTRHRTIRLPRSRHPGRPSVTPMTISAAMRAPVDMITGSVKTPAVWNGQVDHVKT